jgi:hypothetical protein
VATGKLGFSCHRRRLGDAIRFIVNGVLMRFRLVRLAVVIAIGLLMVFGAAWYFAWGESGVQPLPMMGFGDRLPRPNQITAFSNRDDLGPLAGRNSALLAQVDFAEHDLVRIGWQADGPMFGSLCFAERRGGQQILFYVDCPSADYSTFSRRVAEDWFVVPKGAQVELGTSAQVTAYDAAFWITEAALAVLAWRMGRGVCRSAAKQSHVIC